MKRNILGKTGIEVSELAFGTLIFARIQADMTPEDAAPAVSKALEMGINFYDTATSYGTQDHLRVGLGDEINNVVIATKTHARNRERAEKDFERSLRELGREYIDIYHMHLINDAEDLANRREVVDYFLEIKEKGLIRAFGASAHTVKAARAIGSDPDIDILFPILNYQGLGIMDGSVEDMVEACRLAKDRGKGVYAMKPLAGGHLRQSPQKAFDFLRATRLMDSICTGMKSPAEVEMNVAIFEGRDVPQESLSQVKIVPRSLKIYDFQCVGCGSCVDVCDQGALHIDYSQADESKDKKGQSVVDESKCILCGYCAEACPKFAIRVI